MACTEKRRVKAQAGLTPLALEKPGHRPTGKAGELVLALARGEGLKLYTRKYLTAIRERS